MTDKSVVIVIPIYKDKLSPTEVISLKQLNKILGKYPRVFVAPQSLVFDFGSLGEGIAVERFEDHWFQSVTSYSCLMMQKDFYARFSAYEYMLLYQLDVFVFSDRLKEFCDMRFDYIGAPIGRFAPFWHAIGARVGNGGFSLRRIPSVIRVLDDIDRIIADTPFVHTFILAEDIFFAYCGVRDDIEFKVADIDTAFGFSVQENTRHIFKKIQRGWRPFGCHGWSRIEQDFWWPVIEEHGYTMPGKTGGLPVYTRALCHNYLSVRRLIDLQPVWGWLKRGELSKLDNFLEKALSIFPVGHSVWSGRLEELSLFWATALEGVLRGKLPEKVNREPMLEAVYRAMCQGESPAYLWEMWDMLLPILGKEPYVLRDKIISLILAKKLERYVLAETKKIGELQKEKGQMTEREYSIGKQVRLQAGEKLFEKALGWNLSTDTEVWKLYTKELMKL
ncbi:MAG: DUF5672 family protein [Schwartzia succinivorans]|nr:DUF5672 family protein [Schwartzia succinivorans]